ncbi:amidohydrolase [Luethyella okanaganae]|uniref:Amidohydrolase n=1 Tax=Luethyella okanaganae TaxID=69372 RepID=A0ABW1V9W3_9MICO
MQHVERESADGPAELVFLGGTVHTLGTGERAAATALAVRHGRVTRVGRDEEVVQQIGRKTRVVELSGRAVIPGINDSHMHATWLGAMWPRTIFDTAGALAPVDPEGEAGHATGPRLGTRGERRAAILAAGRLAATLGITSYTEPGLGPGEDDGPTGCFGQAVFEEYVALEAERLLLARVNVLLLFGELDGPSHLHDYVDGMRGASRETARPAWLRIAGVKIFADGIPPMHTAWTHGRYPDGTSGRLMVSGLDDAEREANLRSMIRVAHRAGYQVGVHATGDRSIAVAVDAVAEAMREHRVDLRHYVIHGDLVTAEVLGSMAENGMGLNVQPGIAVKTSGWVAGVLGEDAAGSAWPIADALASGVNVCLSSDAPVLSPDWREGIAAADAWMGPAKGGEQVARMLALLRAYTVAPARQDGADGWKGTLDDGRVADLCVLATDPITVAPAELPSVPIDMTVVDGEVVFERAHSS